MNSPIYQNGNLIQAFGDGFEFPISILEGNE
jgi:hypothetical protein